MGRRGVQDLDAILAGLARGRRATVKVLASSPIHHPAYRAGEEVLVAIDRLAEALTGDAQALWAQAPGTFQPPRR